MTMALRNMSQAECLAILERSHYGHLACCNDGQPYVVPLHFAFQARVAYSFSMPGQKIEWMRQNPNVCLQVEESQRTGSWKSVILNGRFQELTDTGAWHEERLHAWSLLAKHSDFWEVGSLKPVVVPPASASPHLFYCIYLNGVSGRAATQGD